MNQQFYIKLFFRFCIILLFQVLVLNNVHLSGLLNPYFYPIFILSLPLMMPQWICLLLAFAMGFSVGVFTNSSGLHAMSLLIITALRPLAIVLIFPQIKKDDTDEINIYRAGPLNFILYLLILLYIHHFVYFIVEVWSFSLFYLTILKIFLSTLMSAVLILMSEYFFIKKK